MSQTKAQREAAARAKKTAAQQEVQPAAETKRPAAVEQSKAATQTAKPAPAAAAPAQPSKQTQTIDKLKEGWTAKGVDLSKLSIKDDGKFKLLVVDQGWPTCQIGPTGGLTVLELKSYSKAFDAAMDGLALYQKQGAREQKKTAATAPTPKAAAPEAVTA
jgi:hypothetical protein